MIRGAHLRPIVAAGLLAAPLFAEAQPAPPSTPLVGLIVGMSLLFVLGIIAIALLGPQWLLRHALRERAELVDKLLAAGQPVPPELLAPPSPPPLPPHQTPVVSRMRSLRHGVGLLAFGVGIAAVAYFGFGSPRMASWGFLFLALSIASFVNATFFSSERAADRRWRLQRGRSCSFAGKAAPRADGPMSVARGRGRHRQPSHVARCVARDLAARGPAGRCRRVWSNRDIAADVGRGGGAVHGALSVARACGDGGSLDNLEAVQIDRFFGRHLGLGTCERRANAAAGDATDS